jgi:uncharacterized membrane protein YeaQ/YmgE (transglycosylase-associated protein family)
MVKIFKKIVIGYVFYTFPVTLVGLLIIDIYDLPPSYGVFLNTICYIVGAQIAIWVLTSLPLTISMFFSRSIRDSILVKLTGIKERDEREIQIVGKALRTSYLTSMTILLFLLFISLFQVEISKKSAYNVEEGQHRGVAAVGMKFNLIDSDALIMQKDGYDFFYAYTNIPLSTSSLIIILLLVQIISYRIVSRKSLRLPYCPDDD